MAKRKNNVRTEEPSQYALDTAFRRSKLENYGWSYETAMANPVYARALRRAAQAIDKPRPIDHKMRAANDAN